MRLGGAIGSGGVFCLGGERGWGCARAAAVSLVFVIGSAGGIRAQQAAAVPSGLSPAGSSRVVLDVVAQDHSGKPVEGLGREDFHVFENGQERPLEGFRAVGGGTGSVTGGPGEGLRALLVIDEVNTGVTRVAFEREQVDQFLKANGGELPQPTSLVLFSETSIQAIPEATRDGKELAQRLDKSQSELREVGRAAGFYGAVERFQLSIAALRNICASQRAVPGRKLLIWISPGWPLLSGPDVQLSKREQESIFQTIVQVSTEMREARVTLYSVDPLGTADAGTLRQTYYQVFLKGKQSAKDVDAGDLGLQVLAVQSGGQALTGSNSTRALISRCYDDARSFYELSFAAAPAEHRDEYRAVEVRSAHPGLRMQTRTGYYVEP